MAKLTSGSKLKLAPSLATLGVTDTAAGTSGGSIWVDTSTFQITISEWICSDDATRTLSSDGVTIQAVYSFLKDLWKDNANYPMFEFPMEGITPNQFEMIKGWSFSTVDSLATRLLIRDGGWTLRDIEATIQDIVMNVTTLGNFNAGTDQAYYLQSAGGSIVQVNLPGEVNQAVTVYNWKNYGNGTDLTYSSAGKTITSAAGAGGVSFLGLVDGDKLIVRGSGSNNGTYTVSGSATATVVTVAEALVDEGTADAAGSFFGDTVITDNRDFFQIFLREQGKTYAFYDLNVSQAITTLENTKYAMPLENATDLNIVASDAYIAFTDTQVDVSFTASTKTIASTLMALDTFSDGDRIVVSGSTSNDGTYTVTGTPTANSLVVVEILIDESASASVTIDSIYQAMSITWYPKLTASASDLTYVNGTSDTSSITSAADFNFTTLGYKTGQRIYLDATTVGNDGVYTIATVSAGVLTLVGDNVFATAETDTGTPTINQSRQIGQSGDDYDFTIIIDGNGGTTQEIYEFVQYNLRQSGDIDTGPDSEIGQVTEALLEFVGSTLYTKKITDGGVYIDDFNTSYTNDIIMTDDLGVEHSFPFVAAGTISFNSFLQTDGANASYWVFFADAGGNLFNTSNAIIVQDNAGPTNISGTVSGSSISFDFNYQYNTQGGRTPNTPAPIVLIAIGLSNAQHVKATGTIIRSTVNAFTLTAAQERNYAA